MPGGAAASFPPSFHRHEGEGAGLVALALQLSPSVLPLCPAVRPACPRERPGAAIALRCDLTGAEVPGGHGPGCPAAPGGLLGLGKGASAGGSTDVEGPARGRVWRQGAVLPA